MPLVHGLVPRKRAVALREDPVLPPSSDDVVSCCGFDGRRKDEDIMVD
jgi:hypothetical protein